MYHTKLPCRHVLTLGLTIYRDKCKTAQLREFGISNNLLSLLIKALVMDRLQSPHTHERVDQNNADTASIHNDILPDVHLLTWSEKEGVDLDPQIREYLCYRNEEKYFPQLRSKFSAQVDNVTRTETNRRVS